MDLALQHYGSVVYATDIAHANNMSITDDLTPTIILPDIETTDADKAIVTKLQKNTLASKQP